MAAEKRKIYPPMYLGFGLLSIWALQKWWPVVQFQAVWVQWLGTVLILLGLVFTGWAAGLFGKAGTPLIPFTKSTAIVTTGPYKITRNPMYLGMALILTGAAFYFGAFSGLLPVVLFMWVIQMRFILGEERYMEELFGEEYLAYKRQVRRWL